jgi:hypothetical protein
MAAVIGNYPHQRTFANFSQELHRKPLTMQSR